jgi:ADP-heptose:LPS heptosyltransferase
MAAVERGIKRRKGEPSPRDIKNFLILQHGKALGTVVHTTPLIAALREAVPGCRIVVVASGMSKEIYRRSPEVESVIDTPDPTKDVKGAMRALRGKKLFDGEPFCTLTPLGNERTTVAMQAAVAGTWLRAGFTVVPDFFALPLSFDPALSQIDNNLRIITALGHPVKFHEPRIHFTDAELEFARALLSSAGAPEGRPIAIFVTQTSPTQRKSWRPERFQAAARFLHEQHDAFVVFVGTSTESLAIDELRTDLDFPTANLAGKTNLTQLAALLSLGSVGLTLDTGTMHVGRAVGLPMVIVAPAWSPPVEWLPLNNPRYRIFKNLDTPKATPDYIIDEVSVDEVTAALADLMTQYPAHSS